MSVRQRELQTIACHLRRHDRRNSCGTLNHNEVAPERVDNVDFCAKKIARSLIVREIRVGSGNRWPLGYRGTTHSCEQKRNGTPSYHSRERSNDLRLSGGPRVQPGRDAPFAGPSAPSVG
jgi:hypothetical protein